MWAAAAAAGVVMVEERGVPVLKCSTLSAEVKVPISSLLVCVCVENKPFQSQ